MKRFRAIAACAVVSTAIAACKGGEAATPAAPEAAASAAPAPAPPARTDSPVAETAAVQPVVAGAPAFAVLYPGATLEDDPVVASGPDGPGGLVTYLTDADPEAVIAFHRERAEAAGLSSVMAMNQGDARAYGAAKAKANLQVVAAPTPEGRTSVQLSWSAAG